MIPLRSSEPHYTAPTVTLMLIALNVLVFFYELTLPQLPVEPVHVRVRNRAGPPATLLPSALPCSSTAAFCTSWETCGSCGSSGAAIEDILGHAKYLVFYLACGVAAAIGHILTNAGSPVPTIGASGAIAGVMGAYLVKFPRARIVTLVFILIFLTTVDLPAAFLLLYWFAIQFFNGVGSVGYSQASSGNVAWFAHVAGFVAGIGLIFLMRPKQRARSWY